MVFIPDLTATHAITSTYIYIPMLTVLQYFIPEIMYIVLCLVFMIGYDLKKVKNTTDHHTESYDGDNSVVLRRGKEFSFELHFSGPFKLTENNFVEIELTRGTNPQLSDATKFLIHFSETEKKGGSGDYNWKGDIEHLSDTRVDVTVSIPSNCPIGSYEMLVTTSSGVNYSRPTRESIVILFNPWNEGIRL